MPTVPTVPPPCERGVRRASRAGRTGQRAAPVVVGRAARRGHRASPRRAVVVSASSRSLEWIASLVKWPEWRFCGLMPPMPRHAPSFHFVWHSSTRRGQKKRGAVGAGRGEERGPRRAAAAPSGRASGAGAVGLDGEGGRNGRGGRHEPGEVGLRRAFCGGRLVSAGHGGTLSRVGPAPLKSTATGSLLCQLPRSRCGDQPAAAPLMLAASVHAHPLS